MSGSRAPQPADGLEARDGAATRLQSDSTSATQDVLLDVRDLSVVYESSGQTAVQAVDHVSFQLRKGEFVGLVGESGSGKSTLGYALTRLQKPPARTNGGNIFFGGHDIRDLGDEELFERLEADKEELFNLRFQLATGQLDNPMRIKDVRHEIARILTVVTERGTELEQDAAPRAESGAESESEAS